MLFFSLPPSVSLHLSFFPFRSLSLPLVHPPDAWRPDRSQHASAAEDDDGADHLSIHLHLQSTHPVPTQLPAHLSLNPLPSPQPFRGLLANRFLPASCQTAEQWRNCNRWIQHGCCCWLGSGRPFLSVLTKAQWRSLDGERRSSIVTWGKEKMVVPLNNSIIITEISLWVITLHNDYI